MRRTASRRCRAQLRGKVVLLDFWTLACVNCQRVLEELRGLERRFADALVVVGVHSPKFPHEHDHAAVRAAVARHRIEHPVLDDPAMATWDAYAVQGVADARADRRRRAASR